MAKRKFEIADDEFVARKAAEDKARDRLNKQDQKFWRDLARQCSKIANIEDPHKREIAVEAYFVDMHGEAPKFLTRYLQKKQLPAIGDFDEVDRGVVSPAVYWVEEDLSDFEIETGDSDESLEIASIEA